MQVVEFTNEFHLKVDFGRFKDYHTNMIKSIVKVIEWTTSIFDGKYISHPTEIGYFLVPKNQWDTIEKPFEFKKDNSSITFRNYVSVAKFNWEKKAYIVPANFIKEVYTLGKICKASHIKIGEQLPEEVDVISPLPDLDFHIPLLMGEMRDYQKKGVARGIQLKKYINGDMPGLGKTLQSIATLEGAAIKGEDVFPALVICPSALKINWLREFEQWTGRKAIVLNDKIKTSWHVYYEIGEADVFITNPESLRKYFVRKYPNKADLKTSADIEMDPRIDRFKSVIIDEIHKLKNMESQRSKIALRVTRGKNYIIGLTGTPVVNKPSDLLAQLGIISRLKKFGGLNGFKARYCEGGSGSSNLKELNFLLNKNCFFRREKHEVLKDLPAKMRQTIFCSLDPDIQKEYSKAENNFRAFLVDNDFTDKEIAKKLRSAVIVQITMLLQLSAKGKIEAAREYIDEIVDSGQKIVVFCRHRIVVDLLCEIYPQAVRVTGSENEIQKQNSVDSFQKSEKTNIIIGSHRAAGVGLTLTASSEVLFLELPWTFADLEQCEDRCHRMGQPESVRCTSLLGENTIDNWLYELIMEKKKIADAVTGADDIVPVSVVDSIMNVFKK
ncbi:DEAD/DEAH box helicase [Chryseobacterium sp. SNU WT5]|uniref:DEAD/DEAH box helicase n=1 Tax=Chryseobacterium sp. SNU WT5 TaxID=2594269 RepID=UPI00117D88F3|nr:DEAD/DEAH box helicase [Chryseobacterium sp. SNU WT5]QDP86050.1 DEAD/DEAH box helicase [Chryseobacterium sp. SNU WT5]